MLPLEAVPNFSEGRDAATIDALGEALSEHARVLDLHVDRDHHRCVFTLVAEPAALVEALAAATAVAVERIDLRTQDGVHPRIGAADVVPVVALDAERADEALAVADAVADRVAALGVPVFLYALSGGGRRPHDLRAGGPRRLAERLARGELAPDRGPGRLHPSAGAAIVGARPVLVAFNVALRGADLAVARALAGRVRERDGGLPGVRALGLELPETGVVQVSMNIEDPVRTPLYRVLEVLRGEARVFGVELGRAELVGLLPAAAVTAVAAQALSLPTLSPAHVLESRLLAEDAVAFAGAGR
jgi:glutamate formiminotransferase/glutamate formiminotransferase/formiminotetrahydrofolate cyclodeaminase